MDYRDFERANELCKPKHFAQPGALQRRLLREQASRLPAEQPRAGRLLRWLRRLIAHASSAARSRR